MHGRPEKGKQRSHAWYSGCTIDECSLFTSRNNKKQFHLVHLQSMVVHADLQIAAESHRMAFIDSVSDDDQPSLQYWIKCDDRRTFPPDKYDV